jgi:hypothetical protein
MSQLTFFLRLNDPSAGNSFALCATNGQPMPAYGVQHQGLTIDFPIDGRCLDLLVKQGWNLGSKLEQTIVMHHSVNVPRFEGDFVEQADGTYVACSRHTIGGHNVISDSKLILFGITNSSFFGACNPGDEQSFAPLQIIIDKSRIHKNTRFVIFGE